MSVTDDVTFNSSGIFGRLPNPLNPATKHLKPGFSFEPAVRISIPHQATTLFLRLNRRSAGWEWAQTPTKFMLLAKMDFTFEKGVL